VTNLNLINTNEEILQEKFEKTYIPVQEFVESWEKEIYELNNLDYFIFLVINNLGYHLEHSFFSDKNKNPYLQIDPEEIGTLSFNIGDSLESFLENNCLTKCSLACPWKLSKELTEEEKKYVENNLHIVHIINEDNWSRKQFLVTDILNYTVLDTLFDFYNYDIGIDIEETDLGLLQLADFITDILVRFIHTSGHNYLEKPLEPAVNLFDKLMAETEHFWKDDDPNEPDEDIEPSEVWKLGHNKVETLCEEFLSNQDEFDNGNSQRILEYLSNYMASYSAINKVDDLEEQDIEEFISFWLIRELTLDSFIEPEKAIDLFLKFFKWLEFSKEIYLAEIYNSFINSNKDEVLQVITSAKKYLNDKSVIDGILESNAVEGEMLDGYFEIVSIKNNGFFRLRDIHLNKVFYNVRIENNYRELFRQGNIIEATIKPTAYGWRIMNLDYIFPKVAKPYLH